jgi:hypothetical protein
MLKSLVNLASRNSLRFTSSSGAMNIAEEAERLRTMTQKNGMAATRSTANLFVQSYSIIEGKGREGESGRLWVSKKKGSKGV